MNHTELIPIVSCFFVVMIAVVYLLTKRNYQQLKISNEKLQQLSHLLNEKLQLAESVFGGIYDNGRGRENANIGSTVCDRESLHSSEHYAPSLPWSDISFYTYHSLNLNQGQTIFEQHWLTAALSTDARLYPEKEVEAISKLANGQCLEMLNSSKTLTVFSLLDQNDWSSLLPETDFARYIKLSLNSEWIDSLRNPQDITSAPFFKVPGLLKKTDCLLMSNPYAANLLLLYPTLIQQMSAKIKNVFAFPLFCNPNKFSVSWDDTFSDCEYDQQHYWRWALMYRAHSLVLTNNTLNTYRIRFKLMLRLIQPGSFTFKVYFLNSYFTYTVQDGANLEFTFAVPPGHHRLVFVCLSPAARTAEDPRYLHFGIVDLMLASEGGGIQLSKEEIYKELLSHTLSPFDDAAVRNMLHLNGFFEVRAVSVASNGSGYQNLATTRFHLLNGHYEYQPLEEVRAAIGFVPNVVWYIAKRGATFLGRESSV